MLGTIKKTDEIVHVIAPLVAREQNSFRVTQVKNSVYRSVTEFSQNQSK